MMDTSALGLRDGILLLAGLAGVYFVFLLLRLIQIKNHKRQKARFGLDGPQVRLDAADPREKSETPNVVQPPSFAEEMHRSALEAEILQLRGELKTLRSELQAMGSSVAHLKSSSHVSPLYSSAMGFAQQGVDAAGIAARCGIAVAEAELVIALARGQQEHDNQEGAGYGGARTKH